MAEVADARLYVLFGSSWGYLGLTKGLSAFHHREGIALSTVTYDDDGVVRPVFYRLSLAEMVVPYAAPEHPHPRKFAFDS